MEDAGWVTLNDPWLIWKMQYKPPCIYSVHACSSITQPIWISDVCMETCGEEACFDWTVHHRLSVTHYTGTCTCSRTRTCTGSCQLENNLIKYIGSSEEFWDMSAYLQCSNCCVYRGFDPNFSIWPSSDPHSSAWPWDSHPLLLSTPANKSLNRGCFPHVHSQFFWVNLSNGILDATCAF